MKKTKLYLNPLAAAIALMSGTFVAPQIAFAQDEDQVEEEVLIVSARRRDETLHEVPIALSSFTGEAMEKAGIQDLVQIAASVPNTTLKVSRGSNTTITAFIRGVGQQDPVAGFEAGVGLYVDDVYLNRPQGAVLDVYDVERVEILRGPQGTLYGRNTIGGAIKYITKRLSDEPELSIKGSLGSYGQADLIVSGSMPFADEKVKIGGSIASFNRDGFGKNVVTGEEHYNKDVFAARVSLELTPSDTLSIRLSADTSTDKSAPKTGYRITPDPAVIADGVPRTEDIDIFDSRSNLTEIGHPIDENKVDASGFAAIVEWDINDSLTFKSTTAFRDDETTSPIDLDALPGAAFDVFVKYENDQLSQEFQLNFEGERVQGLAGIYYLDARAFNAFDVVVAEGAVNIATVGDVDTKTWAIYTDFNINLSDTISLSLGARYTDDERSVSQISDEYGANTGAQAGTLGSPAYFGGNGASILTPVVDDAGNQISVGDDPIFLNPRTGSQLVREFEGSRTDSAFTPKISVSWQPDDETHFYASFSQGFKGGGFDPRGNYSSAPVRDGFAPETIDAYEIGYKSTALDGQISSNLAFFYSDYQDVQIPSSIGIDTDDDGVDDSFVGGTTNAAAATIRGVEYDVKMNVTDNFTSTLAIGLIDAKYDEYRSLSGSDISSTQVFQNTPEATASLGLNYNVSVGAGELSLVGSANYRSLTYQFGTANAGLDQAGYTIFNASAVWTSDDDHWQIGLHGRNLSDKEYIVAGYAFSFRTAFYGNPRTVTGTVKYNF